MLGLCDKHIRIYFTFYEYMQNEIKKMPNVSGIMRRQRKMHWVVSINFNFDNHRPFQDFFSPHNINLTTDIYKI